MIKPEQPRIEIDDLTAVIRESIAAQQHENGFVSARATENPIPSVVPELKLQPDFQPRSNNRYHISDLLRYHDRAFVENAYRAILKRPPDATEFARDIKRLRSGQANKIDLLATLRYSNEGKAKGVELEGLTVPAMVRRLGQLPLVGYFVRLVIALVRLPNQVRDQREFAGYVLSQNQQIADFVNVVSARVAECNQGLARIEERLTTEVALLTERTALAEDRIAAGKKLLQTQIEEIRVQTEQLQGLVEELQRVPDFHHLDALYAALEDRFRGSHEEIKDRFRVYLPYVQSAGDVIDLGCGRGEWLELLNETGITARGIEQNRVLIDRCRELGLEVVEEDMLAHLRGLPDESTGAITGFHIIEHVSIDTLVSLLDEVLRVLRPGGIAIFETPNPENVLVGSNFFYLDPTHHHPLPSELMQFLVKSRGFHPTEVLNLHPWDAGRVAGEGELAERFNGYFFGPMDYAIMGWKLAPQKSTS
ncbi:MAG TPA: methyltransferase domain-containing protein [Pyrinomonadaceae bacterium]|nr:methyltransferase domain-containing protein [Pyrinomonadaceae bacterium]